MRTASEIRHRIAAIEEARRKGTERQITLNDQGMIIHALEQDKIYIPTATGRIAHDDNSFVRVIMGPYGSGKSTWAASEIVKRACEIQDGTAEGDEVVGVLFEILLASCQAQP